MGHPGLANQQHLLRWADSTRARSELPRLIRRLILESGNGVVELGFPADEGVSAGGWDGSVRTIGATAFVPRGASYWELSVEKSVNTKANSDYNKRTESASEFDLAASTYVAVSARRWRERRAWAATQSRAGRWQEVRAYGVDDIETWLEVAPVTHAWLSDQLGLGPYGLKPAELWWNGWSSATTPAIPIDLVLAGREEAAAELNRRLTDQPTLITVKGGSLEDVLAVLAAVATRAAANDSGQMLARMAYVDDTATWRALMAQESPLVLVPLRGVNVAEVHSSASHHIIIPLISGSAADVELPAIDSNSAGVALKIAGVTGDRAADRAGKLARRSLLALRRHLANKPELHQPSWAVRPAGRHTRSVLLAGAWSEGRIGDRAVLAKLADIDYDNLSEFLAGQASAEDPMIAVVDRTWALVSAYDAWLQLRGQIKLDDLKRLEKAVTTVFLEIAPALDIEEQDGWRAGTIERAREYSNELRRGLAATLALLGVHGAHIDAGGGADGIAWATHLVRKLLDAANDDSTGRCWASISDLLPLIAEASPDAFLASVMAGLQGTKPVVAQLFKDREGTDSLNFDSPHTHLLWALESVAWSSEHFGQTVDVLVRLAEIDPGGRLSNRPFSSLQSIFCPWHPENSVTVLRRLAVIDAMRSHHNVIAWQLMLTLLPVRGAMHVPTHEPDFRDWRPTREPVTSVEYWKFIDGIAVWLIADAGLSVERWQSLIVKLRDLPTKYRERCQHALAACVNQIDPADGQHHALWITIERVFAHNRDDASGESSLSPTEVDAWREIAATLAPSEMAARVAWLFDDYWPPVGDKALRANFEEYQALLALRRREAVADVFFAEGIDGIIRLSESSVVPWMVGVALADLENEELEAQIVGLADSERPSDVSLSLAFVSQRYKHEGWSWIERLVDSSDRSSRHRARILRCTANFPTAWEFAEVLGTEVRAAFWAEFVPHGLGPDFQYVARAAQELFTVGRLAVGVHLIGLYQRSVDLDHKELVLILAGGLEALLRNADQDPEIGTLSTDDFGAMFEYLEDHVETVSAARLAGLEWQYLQVLGYEAKVITLHKAIAEDPAFFVELITAMYRPRSLDEPREVTPELRERALNSRLLLNSWKGLPGEGVGDTVNGAFLRNWVFEALRQLTIADRREVGEEHIGHILASAPADPDGLWPCREVRELLEELQSERVERGLSIETFNRRGITSRAMDEGGAQERALVDYYRAQADRVIDQWPRTAAILKGLATTYGHDARREESDAERVRRGFRH